MRKTFPFCSASPASWRETLPVRIAVSGLFCAFLTSAIVLAQDPKPVLPPQRPPLKAVLQKQVDSKDFKKAQPKAKAATLKGFVQKQAVLVVNANVNPMIQQWVQQGRPILRAELLFARHICNLNPEQLRPISRETEQTLNDIAKKMADDQQNGFRIRLPGKAATTPDPGNQLQDALALVIKKHLTPEQYAHYRSEFDKRSANRKQAALTFLVDVLDRDLVLSSQQREKVTESLSAHWEDGWCMYMEYVLYGNLFYPSGVDPYVTPLLSDHQKKVWQGVQKVQGFWGFGNNMGGMINDGDPLLAELGLEEKRDPEPAAAAKGAMKNGQMRKLEGKKEAVTKK
jgi:hypothetical protein